MVCESVLTLSRKMREVRKRFAPSYDRECQEALDGL